jgi:hypothetical protein
MKNLKNPISLEICTLDSKVPSAFYIYINRQLVCLEEDFQESMSFCHTYILDCILDLKQFKIKLEERTDEDEEVNNG